MIGCTDLLDVFLNVLRIVRRDLNVLVHAQFRLLFDWVLQVSKVCRQCVYSAYGFDILNGRPVL